jgi:hypothetical protein
MREAIARNWCKDTALLYRQVRKSKKGNAMYKIGAEWTIGISIAKRLALSMTQADDAFSTWSAFRLMDLPLNAPSTMRLPHGATST